LRRAPGDPRPPPRTPRSAWRSATSPTSPREEGGALGMSRHPPPPRYVRLYVSTRQGLKDRCGIGEFHAELVVLSSDPRSLDGHVLMVPMFLFTD
jgi:hypothetical protein